MSFLIVCITALLASGLTLFSGFGLGTVLLPAFAIFFPIEVAVAMTAVKLRPVVAADDRSPSVVDRQYLWATDI